MANLVKFLSIDLVNTNINMTLVMTERSLRSRSRSEPVDDTIRMEPPPEETLRQTIVRLTASRGRTGSRGRGRGCGKAPRKTAEPARTKTRGRPKGQTSRRVEVEEEPIEIEASQHESTASAPLNTAAFVTKEAFDAKMDELQQALKALLENQQKSNSEGSGKKTIAEDSNCPQRKWMVTLVRHRWYLPCRSHLRGVASKHSRRVSLRPIMGNGTQSWQ
ncbi:hypothetical protein OSB04_020594 [Centaurea solstitialis]|uniref:Uncharacterized protein n=1 Tax=Centaurea solstitialis TaxID=347529 RepID=A0AA38T3Y2_9ASTR|nr:hypothetical protein OSB04_020594 [Centaurea solstitialis]